MTALLASEQRQHDRHVREIDQILALARQVEARSAYRPPASQVLGHAEPIDPPAVLSRGQALRDWHRQRAGSRGDAGPAPRLGAVIRALATGNRRGLSPLEVRALSEGVAGDGGFTVPEVLAVDFIDRLRARSVCFAAGALTVPMTTDTLHLARIGQPDSVSPTISGPAWKGENELIVENGLALERLTFTARTLPMLIKLSVELGEDSTNIDAVIETELANAMALELDRAALFGSGAAPEPRGVRNQAGVGVTSFGAATPDDFDFMIDALGRLWGQNTEPNARLMNARLATTVAKFKSSADDQPLRVPDVVAAVPAFRTQQIATALTSPITTALILGDFTQLLIGLRTSFRLEISRLGGDSFERLQIGVRAYLRADVQLAHPEAFDVTTDIAV